MRTYFFTLLVIAAVASRAELISFAPGQPASASAVNANFHLLDTSLTNSVARLQAALLALQEKAKADSSQLAGQIATLRAKAQADSSASLVSIQAKAKADSAEFATRLVQIQAKAKLDSSTLVARMQADSAAIGTQSIPKGTVAGFLVAPGVDNYLPGSAGAWYIANGQTVNGIKTPDLRGQFLRGMNAGRTDSLADPTAGRPVGSQQGDAFQGHWHNSFGSNSSDVTKTGNWTAPGIGSTATSGPISDGTNGAPRTASETRPKNVAVYWYVKVK